jgi:hypothetical protein
MIYEQLLDGFDNDITQQMEDFNLIKVMPLRELIDLFNIYGGTKNLSGADQTLFRLIKMTLTDRINGNQ